VVAERFAIRGLLTALSRSSNARGVVLSRTKTRCVDLTGRTAVERHDFGFPVEVEAPVEADAPHRDFPLDEHEHAEAAKFVFRAVDDAPRSLQRNDERPLVLLGAVRDLAYFDEVTAQHESIIGRVQGDYERATVGTIADLMLPILEQHRRDREQQACDDAREAIGRGAVAGIPQAWAAARAGRGRVLVVEEPLRYPARVVDDALEGARADDPDAFDAVEDTIEEVIRHGGEVVVVPGDSLTDLAGIALLTRYEAPAHT
jgi:hypothetical protein